MCAFAFAFVSVRGCVRVLYCVAVFRFDLVSFSCFDLLAFALLCAFVFDL